MSRDDKSRRPGIIAAILTLDARRSLLDSVSPRYPVVYAHHLTLAFRPAEATYEKYAAFLGKPCLIRVMEEVWDGQGQAVRVSIETAGAESNCPHITVSCVDSVAPKYSQKLLANAAASSRPLSLQLGAVICFMTFREWDKRFSPQPSKTSPPSPPKT